MGTEIPNKTATVRAVISKDDRAKRYCQKPVVIWFTGLSGAGKSTLARALEQTLFSLGFNAYNLDGDTVRQGLCSDLGFSDKDRKANIRRVGEVAKLMLDTGCITLASFISPFLKDRQTVRGLLEQGEFIEVYMSAPLSVCEGRDAKGLYKRARSGEIKNFTGVGSEYEPPLQPDIEINTQYLGIDESVEKVLLELKARKVI